MTDCNGCPVAQRGPEGWCFAVDPCPQSNVDRRYFNRHAPAMQLWQGDEPENVRLYMEPIEDEESSQPGYLAYLASLNL
jgi:hypothetical protein